MAEQPGFLWLARRLGNPIADRPDAIAAIEAFELVTAFRILPRRQQRIVRATLGCLAWLQRGKVVPRPVSPLA